MRKKKEEQCSTCFQENAKCQVDGASEEPEKRTITREKPLSSERVTLADCRGDEEFFLERACGISGARERIEKSQKKGETVDCRVE